MDALPAYVHQELVMSTTTLDSQRLTAYRLRSDEPPQALAATLRERWRRAGMAFVESRNGEWMILSVRERAQLNTIQLRATDRGSEGLSARWSAPVPTSADGMPPLGDPLAAWLPAQSQVLRRIDHLDDGRRAATLVAVLLGTVPEAIRMLRQRAGEQGFTEDPALGLPAARASWFRGGGPSAAGAALAFRNGPQALVATVSEHRDRTAVVLHWGVSQ